MSIDRVFSYISEIYPQSTTAEGIVARLRLTAAEVSGILSTLLVQGRVLRTTIPGTTAYLAGVPERVRKALVTYGLSGATASTIATKLGLGSNQVADTLDRLVVLTFATKRTSDPETRYISTQVTGE
jgi:DNA-binding IclR family transcriptional regulator